MGQTTRKITPSPFPSKHGFYAKHDSVYIARLECRRNGHGIREFRAVCNVEKGKDAGKEVAAFLSEYDAVQTFEQWCSVSTMKVDESYTFPTDDRPIGIINYKDSTRHTLTDVKPDLMTRVRIVHDLVGAAGEYPLFNTSDNRRKIEGFDTLESAKTWALQWVEQQKNAPPQITPATENPCTTCGGRQLQSMTTGNLYCPICNSREGKSMIDQTAELDDLKQTGEELTSALDEAFPRPKNKHSTNDPADMVYAVPNYLERELNLDKASKEKNKVAFEIYGCALTEGYITEQTPAAVWIKAEQFVEARLSNNPPLPEPPTKEQWIEWLNANKLKLEYVIELMNLDSIQRGEGNIRKLSEWDLGLEGAQRLVDADNAEKAEKEKTDEKATNSASNSSKVSTPPNQAQQNKSVPQSAPEKSDEPDVQEAEFVEPSKAVAIVANTGIAQLPMVAQWEVMRQQAEVMIKSGFLPKDVNTPEKAITIMMMGSALQIDPIVALNNINVIAGKPTVSPQLMLGLVRRSGQLESFEVSDDGHTCTVKMKRKGEPVHIEKFSMDDAQRMKTTEYINGQKTIISLSEKYNWKQQPATMRKWRAVAAACRVVFPDVTWGIASYTTEEIDPDTEMDDAA